MHDVEYWIGEAYWSKCGKHWASANPVVYRRKFEKVVGQKSGVRVRWKLRMGTCFRLRDGLVEGESKVNR